MTNTGNYISRYVKYNRYKLAMTQAELAEKAGVGLRFVRELEQGKETLRMDKVNQVLALFGNRLKPGPSRIIDPYQILTDHFNRNIRITMKNKTALFGFIIDPISENSEIRAWKFVSNNHATAYQKTKDSALEQRIEHADIEQIENIDDL